MPSTKMLSAPAGSYEILSVVVRPMLVLQLAPLVMLRLAKLVVAGSSTEMPSAPAGSGETAREQG